MEGRDGSDDKLEHMSTTAMLIGVCMRRSISWDKLLCTANCSHSVLMTEVSEEGTSYSRLRTLRLPKVGT